MNQNVDKIKFLPTEIMKISQNKLISIKIYSNFFSINNIFFYKIFFSLILVINFTIFLVP